MSDSVFSMLSRGQNATRGKAMSPDEWKRFKEWVEWDHQCRRELAAIISPSGEWFAWRPVRLQGGGWAWLKRVHWFRPLGLLTEYSEIKR